VIDRQLEGVTFEPCLRFWRSSARAHRQRRADNSWRFTHYSDAPAEQRLPVTLSSPPFHDRVSERSCCLRGPVAWQVHVQICERGGSSRGVLRARRPRGVRGARGARGASLGRRALGGIALGVAMLLTRRHKRSDECDEEDLDTGRDARSLPSPE